MLKQQFSHLQGGIVASAQSDRVPRQQILRVCGEIVAFTAPSRPPTLAGTKIPVQKQQFSHLQGGIVASAQSDRVPRQQILRVCGEIVAFNAPSRPPTLAGTKIPVQKQQFSHLPSGIVASAQSSRVPRQQILCARAIIVAFAALRELRSTQSRLPGRPQTQALPLNRPSELRSAQSRLPKRPQTQALPLHQLLQQVELFHVEFVEQEKVDEGGGAHGEKKQDGGVQAGDDAGQRVHRVRNADRGRGGTHDLRRLGGTLHDADARVASAHQREQACGVDQRGDARSKSEPALGERPDQKQIQDDVRCGRERAGGDGSLHVLQRIENLDQQGVHRYERQAQRVERKGPCRQAPRSRVKRPPLVHEADHRLAVQRRPERKRHGHDQCDRKPRLARAVKRGIVTRRLSLRKPRVHDRDDDGRRERRDHVDEQEAVVERRHAARLQARGEHLVDKGVDLVDSAADKNRHGQRDDGLCGVAQAAARAPREPALQREPEERDGAECRSNQKAHRQ